MPSDSNVLDSANFAAQASKGSNQKDMRAHNERLVLSLLRWHGALPKAEVARTTGLSAQTVSVIMRDLEDQGLIIKGKKIRGKVGQPSIPMRLAADGAYFFGLKVGRRSAEVVLTDFLGRIIAREHQSHRYPTPDSTLKFAQQAVANLSADLSSEQQRRIAGLGIAMPFFLWEWASIIGAESSDMMMWKKRDLRAEIEAFCDFPVYVENDATSACGAELVFGNPKPPRSFLYFYIGYFVGGGIVLNNTVYTGPNGNAAALGTVPMPTHSAKDRQLVDVASLAGLEKLLMNKEQSDDALWKNDGTWSFSEKILNEWSQTAAPAIAMTIVSAISFIDFGHVLIDGWMPDDVRNRLVGEIRAALLKQNLSGLTKPEILPGSLGTDARALGAASLPLAARFLSERQAF